MPKFTRRGIDCPGCDEPASTEFVAQFAIAKQVGTGYEIIGPDTFSVCAGCFFAQRLRRYPDLSLLYEMRDGACVRQRARDILRRRPDAHGDGWDDWRARALAGLAEWEAEDAAACPAPAEVEEAEPELLDETGLVDNQPGFATDPTPAS